MWLTVWFYYSKSLNCCLEVRSILDGGSGACLPAFSTPCNEFTGDCADLIAQFSAVGPDQGGLPPGYVCTQVPSATIHPSSHTSEDHYTDRGDRGDPVNMTIHSEYSNILCDLCSSV